VHGVELLVYVLTIASLVVVVGTRLRLAGLRSAWLALHTWCGLLGFVVWGAFLVAPSSSKVGGSGVGVVGLGLFWVTSVVGLLLIQASRPGGGRRVAEVRSRGAVWLAALVHVGMLVAWIFNTWAYASRRV
jgi:hypothetical protein